jgi:hypothetical protein
MGLWLAAAGCGPKAPAPAAPAPPPAAPPTAAARAAAIRARSATLASVTGHRDTEGLDATWRGYFDGNALLLLEESRADRPRPPLQHRYFYERGTLFYYLGEQPAEAQSGATGPAPRAALRAEFDGLRAVAAVRIEHYGEVRLTPAEIGAIQRRAAELASAAANEHAATQATR